MHGRLLALVQSKLARLFTNNSFKAKMAKAIGMSPKTPVSKLINRTNQWISNNKVMAATTVASILYSTTDILGDVFSGDEYSEVLSLLSQFDPNSPELTESQSEMLDEVMGDGKKGYFGLDEDDIMKSADLIKASIAKTERLAQLLGVPARLVPELVALIQMYEKADGQIYNKLG